MRTVKMWTLLRGQDRGATRARIVALGTVAALLLLLASTALNVPGERASATATTLYAQMTDGVWNNTSSTSWLAQSFTTSSSATSLTSVEIKYRNANSSNSGSTAGTYSLALWSDGGSGPGSQLTSIASSVSVGAWTDGSTTHTLTTPYLMAASTRYFVVLTSTTPTMGWKCNAGAPTSDVTPTPTFTALATSNSGTSWSALTGNCASQNLDMRVTGAIAVAPNLGTFSNVNATYGDSAQTITAPTADTAGSFSYSSSDTSVATVSGTTLSFVGAGTATITATFTPTDTANWTTATTTMVVTVSAATPNLGAFSNVNATYGDSAQTITAPTADTAGSFSYSSSDTSVATVSGTTLSFVGAGTATITATFTPTDTTNWTNATTTMTVTVGAPPPTTTTTTTTTPTASTTTTVAPTTTTTVVPATVAPATTTSTSTTTTTTTPPAAGGDFPAPTPIEPNANIFGDSEAEQVAVVIDARPGDRGAGAPVRIRAVALEPGSALTLTVFSEPTVLLRSTATADGTFEGAAVLPDLEPGRHTVLVEATTDAGTTQVVGAFVLDTDGTIDRLAQPAVLTGYVGPDDPRLTRALQHERPVWDVAARPLTTAAIMVAGVGLLSFAGIGALASSRSTAPAGGLATGEAAAATAAAAGQAAGGRRRRSRAKLANAVTKKLKGIQIESAHRGDASGTWGMPGTAATDAFSRTAPVRVGRWSALLPRIIVDGAWARAMFGSFGFALWPVGVLVAVAASLSGGSSAVVPAFGFLLAMVVIGILDAGAGACAWVTLVVFAVLGGQIEGWPDVRALMGLGILLSTISLLAHVIRPLRRYVATNRSEAWERVFDYVMMPVFVAFASGAMFKAINGLSGLQIVSGGQIADLRWAVYATVIVRLAIEDVASHLYPERMRMVQPGKLASQTRAAGGVSIVVRSVIFLFIAEPFFGLTATTVLAAFLLAVPAVLKLWEDDLPNSATLNRWFPRGLFRFLCMTLLGMYLTSVFIGRNGGDAAVRSSFIWLLLPGVSEGVIELFGRAGGTWPNVIVKRTLGAVVWVTAVSIVTGLITPFV